MPNGKIFTVFSQKDLGGSYQTQILEILPKSGEIILKRLYANRLFMRGAVASNFGKVYISGSKKIKTKICVSIDIFNDYEMTDLPELQFGRFNH